MRWRYLKLIMIAVLLGIMFCAVSYAVKSNEADEKKNSSEAVEMGESERQVTEAEVPAAALAALKKQAGGAEITEFAEEIEYGHTFYEASWKSPDGRNIDCLVTSTGDLVEIEEEMRTGNVPTAVLKASWEAAGEDTRLTFEKKTMILYEVKFQKGESSQELLLTPDGRFVEQEQDKIKAVDEDEDEDENYADDEDDDWDEDDDD
jgi:hypothetical protein